MGNYKDIVYPIRVCGKDRFVGKSESAGYPSIDDGGFVQRPVLDTMAAFFAQAGGPLDAIRLVAR